jgi:predicted CXXCH cytochrome family protein
MNDTRVNPRAGPIVRLGITRGLSGWCLYAIMSLLLVACGHEPPEPAQPEAEPAAAASTLHYERSNDSDDPGVSVGRSAVLASGLAGDVEPLPKPTTALPEDATCITPGCHISIVDAKHIHGPVAVANCESCHDADTGGHVYPLKRAGNETCLFCHPVIGARSQEHAAVEDNGCVSCHDPHRSDANFLMKQPSVEQLCATCHETPLKKYAHGPFAAGQCTVCHQPHEANADNLLRQGDQPDHCFSCHTGIQVRLANSPVVHEPAKQDCTTCHEAHTSDYPYQLSAPVAESCFTCHDQMARRVTSQPVSHDALFIEDGCANCHDPHAAGGQDLLKDRTDNLCMRCHNQPVETADGRVIANMQPTLDRKYLHGPVRAGDCAACHSVHGGENARLLIKRFPDTFYAGFDLSNYALCFGCHSDDLVLSEKTDSLTAFRQGDRNLHYLHVNRTKKGRTCKTCHDIHGSDRPDHIASDVPFEGSQWAMPINFSRTETGGSCSPGCHVARTYKRSQTGTQEPTDTQHSRGGSL